MMERASARNILRNPARYWSRWPRCHNGSARSPRRRARAWLISRPRDGNRLRAAGGAALAVRRHWRAVRCSSRRSTMDPFDVADSDRHIMAPGPLLVLSCPLASPAGGPIIRGRVREAVED